jgi:hydrogenase maturation protein HypF
MPRDDAGAIRQQTLVHALAEPVLALGGQMKACLALGFGRKVVISDDLGDLATPLGLERLEATADALQRGYGVQARTLICDAHHGYTGSRWAKAQADLPVRRVFHHHAHASGLAGEFFAESRWLCFTWDGVGMGADGSLWGGEAFIGGPGSWERVATFRRFAPPGGDIAASEPWRSAAAMAWTLGLDFSIPGRNIALAKAAWQKRVNCPETSAVGRLFDAAAAFLNLVQHADFEAAGPMAVEAIATLDAGLADAVSLPLRRLNDGLLEADWSPLVPLLLDEARSRADRAAAFHASLALTLVVQALALREQHGDFAVGMTGGVFQNRLLVSLARDALTQAGFRTYSPEQNPCHDGGLSFGQVVEASAAL